ncbi:MULTISPECIES: DUF493 domain-containing protein [Sphingobacterium]|uniref:DUF493 domain-containing protein n=1 Tax=Sphingobacterium litopenaei TaxID=2763500 RepID=A0ABR7YBD3_9SPHI|nr:MULTISPECIES: DUF493 domain-containing protein [Sphingobacterium]MBD1428600.1 DUF493 domain-containing protein [Sphingobacterium litopenaei]NGM73403.1 DUF493 domain-containing protein [Sphingobacterium sp. SGL-16]
MSDFNNISINDINDNNGADFYNNFRQKLMDIEQFPSIYTFKFIIPADVDKREQVEKIFEHPSTKISSKDSKTGKYNSLTVETFVQSADEVIDYYKKVSTIEKVIML